MSNQISPIFMKSISMVTAVADVELGTERVESGAVYRYIHNCGGSTASVGKGMSRPVSAVAGLYSASVSGASGDVCLGFVKHVDIPAGEYGWIVKRGTVNVDAGASASFAAGPSPKSLGALGLVATVSAGYAVIGETISAVASGGSAILFVNVP